MKAPPTRSLSIRFDNTSHLIGQEEVVGIQKANDLTSTLGKSNIESRRLPSVFLEDRLNSIFVAFDYSPRVIGGTVVNDDDFYRCVRLSQSTLDGIREKASIVVVVYDDAYKGSIHKGDTGILKKTIFA